MPAVGDSSTTFSKPQAQQSSSDNNSALKPPEKPSPSLSRLSSTEDSIPQQQHQHQQRRPHLAYLRTAWSSRELKTGSKTLDAHAEDLGVPPIELPESSATLSGIDPLQSEVQRLLLATKVACLIALGGQFYYHYQESSSSSSALPLVMIAAWTLMLFMDSSVFDVTCVQILTVFTLAGVSLNIYLGQNSELHNLMAFVLVSTATCLSIVAGRIDLVSKQHLKDERKRAQAFVNESVQGLKDQRLSFLSTVSQEVQDAALMVITTLEQFSPSSILTDTHELLSACSIAVPIASISAINTTIKQVCYVSSHLQLMGRLLRQAPNDETVQSDIRIEFDVGDLVQNIGDALAAMAARLDVNLVIYHSENGMHYTNVLGDEGAIRHGLLNLLRNILEGCTPGACIELGLNIVPAETQGNKLLVSFEIIHSVSPAIPDGLSPAMLPNANLTMQLLQFIGGKLAVSDAGKNKTRFEVTIEMDAGSDGSRRLLLLEDSSLNLINNKQLASIKFSHEPTLKDLFKFIESLKGLKMVLHARERSVFAKHLTSCLAGWNADISHVPVVRQAALGTMDSDDASSTSGEGSSIATAGTGSVAATPQQEMNPITTPELAAAATSSPSSRSTTNKKVPSPAIAEEQIHSIPPAFVLIDDDVETLERKIREFRSQPPVSANTLQHHQHMRRHKHTKSSVNNNNSGSNSPQPNFFHQGTTAIIHFTSLNKFKRVRDTLQMFSTMSNMPFSMPRLVVVPKPAGPRRFLTALHTAWNNAVVEPHFIPIATSPLSPLPQTVSFGSVMQQQRDSFTPPTPGSAYIGTPGVVAGAAGHEVDKRHHHHYHHRGSPIAGVEQPGRRRPNSGVYSPPQVSSSAADGMDGGNYFSMVGNGGSSSSASSIAAAAATRRRSHTELALQQQAEDKHTHQQQQSSPAATAGGGGEAINADGVVPTTAADTVAASALSTAALPEMTNGGVGEQQQQPSSSSMTSPIGGDASKGGASTTVSATSPSTAPNDTTNNSTTPEKKPLVWRKMNFKFNKKKRASAFANVVSPPINVLIVEGKYPPLYKRRNNTINQAILSTWMKKHKIKCSVASNGQEAVERWKGGGFHLVLLPVMNGIDATKTIRAIEKEQRIGVLPTTSPTPSGSTSSAAAVAAAMMDNTSTTTESLTAAASAAAAATQEEPPPSTFRSPVIIVALTASSLESDRHAALAAGCNDFLTKPVSLEWLEKKIIEWGCMQALIDFEGWRRWKRSATDKPALKSGTTSTTTTSQQKEPASTTPNSSGNQATKNRNDEEATKAVSIPPTVEEEEATGSTNNDTKAEPQQSPSATTRNKGIVLPGAAGFSKRRFSTFDEKQSSRGKSILLMSKSGSDSDLLPGRPHGDKDRRNNNIQQQQRPTTHK
ncbi:hypothetical protein BDB00DRAFT_792684 [Zychaea mexicana]|uniref:uncharacterized protein n=1 Tax=Zychaea mexicana TaxID=64656 RepID=UPI0022FE523B|nr:uncharacterized protein BDB00DRAFT_792684 [Zychaea mexicana]KAI9484662.1 hypothetical protein BDB00DRAFT_792684 [Zychaea mexicana]